MSLQRFWRHGLVVLVGIVVALLGYRAYTQKAELELSLTQEEMDKLPVVGFYTWQGDPDEINAEVIGQCQKILNDRWKTDATPWVLLKLANAQRAMRRHEDALKTYDRLGTEFKDSYAAWLASPPRAAVLEDMGRFEEAARLYQKLAAEGRKDSPYWLDAGRAWELARNKEAAIEAYQKLTAVPEASGRDDVTLAAYRMKQLLGGGALLTSPPPPPPPPPPPAPKELPATGEEPKLPELGPAEPQAGEKPAPEPKGPGAEGGAAPPPPAGPAEAGPVEKTEDLP